MKRNNISTSILLIGLLFCFNAILAQNKPKGEKTIKTTEVDNNTIDWERFDKNSTFSKNEIEIGTIQGLWKAYKGVYQFNDHTNGMKLKKPMILEIKGNTYRRNMKSDFEKFKLKDNLIIPNKKNIGVINKITATILTVSWKDGNNYTRYYYTK